MDPVVSVIGLWLLFGGSHIVLSTAPIRQRLVSVLGEAGFVFLYVVVAAVTFACLVFYYANNRIVSVEHHTAAVNIVLLILASIAIVTGLVLISFCVIEYIHSAQAAFANTTVEPSGIARITRHPFLVGNVLLFGTHVLLATSLIDRVFFSGFVTLSIVGMIHQDRKLTTRKGPNYAAFVDETSSIPFLAIMSGRQKLVLAEISLPPVLIGIGIALLLRTIHDSIFNHSGFWFLLAIITIGVVETILALKFNVGRRRPSA